jgi:hypothetical protein
MKLLDILGGPVKALVSAVGGIVDDVTTTDEERLLAKTKLLEIEQAFQVKVLEAEAQWVTAQRDIIVAEAAGHSWLQRNWRPIVMLTMVFFIGFVLFTGGYVNEREIDKEFVLAILDIIKLGLGGYVIGRSAEKIVPQVATIFKNSNKK